MERKCFFWSSVVALHLIFILERSLVISAPIDSGDRSTSLLDKYSGPVMVPVSSTVIPILHLFGRPKKQTTTNNNNQQFTARRSSSVFLSPERRARLFERNNRPEVPGRLITKNSKSKDANNETH